MHGNGPICLKYAQILYYLLFIIYLLLFNLLLPIAYCLLPIALAAQALVAKMPVGSTRAGVSPIGPVLTPLAGPYRE